MWSYTSMPPHVFIAWYYAKHKHKFTFTLLLFENISKSRTQQTNKLHEAASFLRS